MKLDNKCRLLAGELQKILSKGIDLSSEVIHYIDSTFSNPTARELQTILIDDTNCEKDSLMELLLFPDETMQLQLELLLERIHCKKGDEKFVLDNLLQNPMQVTIHFPTDRDAIRLSVTEEIACQFISRLNISKHLAPDLLAAIERYDENIRNRIKVKIRNTRFSFSERKNEFLCLFFEKFDSQDNDIFECLEFIIGFLEDLKHSNDIYQALMAKKKFYFISLQKAKQLETQLQKHNMETLLAQGKRIVLIDQKDARKKMRIIDRISRAIYGKTEFFEPFNEGEDYLELSPEQNVQDIIRTLS